MPKHRGLVETEGKDETMHRTHNHANTRSGPETTGATIHWTSQYDIFANLMGLGVDGSNSRMIVEQLAAYFGANTRDVPCADRKSVV